METYLAKSNPIQTIQQHTNELLKNYYLLKEIYPNLFDDWDILYKACLLHDLGKINSKFQTKIKTGKRIKGELPHAILSILFIDWENLEEEGYSEDDIKLLFHSIAYHHERDVVIEDDDVEKEAELLEKEIENFEYDKIENLNLNLEIDDVYFSINDRILENEEQLFKRYVMIKGLLNRIDYCSSAGIEVEKKNDFLLDDMNKNMLCKFKKENKDADWNELQKFMLKNTDENIIVTAQTGMGKTAAALLWIGNNKGFFTLPLKTAINSIYETIKEDIFSGVNYQSKIGLLHSDIREEYLKLEDEIDFDSYLLTTKQLTMPLTICTIDQLFDFVYKYRGFELKLATLAFSKIVIDEIQMYSADLLSYLILGLSYINKFGGKFAIVTATLPKLFVSLLEKEGIKFVKSKPFINDLKRHNLKIENENIDAEFIKNKFNNNKILVICNTVKKAQKLYEELKNYDEIKENIYLFNSGFIKRDRKNLEKKILEFGKFENSEKGIWVCTQVVEASLDIDFDILITELSDLNGLFQRMGRCNRKGKKDCTKYNCFVFDGGKKRTSGVGYVVDKSIFELSKEKLRAADGLILEEDKLKMIDEIYTAEKLKNTDYYQEIINTLEYVKCIDPFEKSKSEIVGKFRNIFSEKVIPRKVYNKNKQCIEKYINTLKQSYKNLSKEQITKLKHDKIVARIHIEELTISIPGYAIKGNYNLVECLKINDYEQIKIFDCDYDEKEGIKYFKDKKVKNQDDFVIW